MRSRKALFKEVDMAEQVKCDKCEATEGVRYIVDSANMWAGNACLGCVQKTQYERLCERLGVNIGESGDLLEKTHAALDAADVLLEKHRQGDILDMREDLEKALFEQHPEILKLGADIRTKFERTSYSDDPALSYLEFLKKAWARGKSVNMGTPEGRARYAVQESVTHLIIRLPQYKYQGGQGGYWLGRW